jgi:hypothetical protein
VPRIKLIVTGDLEEEALRESLRRYFPTQRNGQDVVWDTPRKLDGATSHKLARGGEPKRPMLALAQAMLDEVSVGKKGQPADLVVVVDDVELANEGQEDVVTQCFLSALERKLIENLKAHPARTEDRYRNLLREKCSFHLLKPMIETYLFGDEKALAIAGVPTCEKPILVGDDVEYFETDDPQWLPFCREANEARKYKTPWWAHERHPKHYLAHLAWRARVLYEETRQGKEALTSLRWSQVPKLPGHTSVIRALFEDIADWFCVSNPLGAGVLHPMVYPAKHIRRTGLLLRNI